MIAGLAVSVVVACFVAEVEVVEFVRTAAYHCLPMMQV